MNNFSKRLYEKNPLTRDQLMNGHYEFLTNPVVLSREDHNLRFSHRRDLRERGLRLPQNDLLDSPFYESIGLDIQKANQAAAAANYNARQGV